MTTTVEQIRELSDALDRDVADTQQRASEAEENLRRAQEECEAANRAIAQALQHRVGFRRTFAEVLGLEAEPEPEINLEVEAEEPESRQSLQLVTAATKPPAAKKPANDRSFSDMTLSDQLQRVMGNQTMTLDEIREALAAHKLEIPNLSNVLSKTKHNVLDANGERKRDSKTGDLVKQNTFVSCGRGTWAVAADESDEPPAEVLTSRAEVDAEIIMNRRLIGARRQ